MAAPPDQLAPRRRPRARMEFAIAPEDGSANPDDNSEIRVTVLVPGTGETPAREMGMEFAQALVQGAFGGAANMLRPQVGAINAVARPIGGVGGLAPQGPGDVRLERLGPNRYRCNRCHEELDAPAAMPHVENHLNPPVVHDLEEVPAPPAPAPVVENP